MIMRTACARDRFLPLALASLFAVAAAGGARGQEWPSAGGADPLAGMTRKLDEYGKIGHCDESARLDNFAITLLNEPGSKGYLLVYLGRNDMPAWKNGILARAADYLVNTRGMDAGRLKVVEAGYREERTTELWVVAGEDPAPQPTNTIEVKLDRTKPYQWDEKNIHVEFNYEAEAAESQEEEAAETDGEDSQAEEGEAEAADEAKAEGGERADSDAAEKQPDGVREAEWDAEVEKYEIAIEKRGLLVEEEVNSVNDPRSAEVAGGVNDPDAETAEANTGPEEGEVRVTLWWNVESFAELLKAEPDSRALLIYYHGAKNADEATVKELVSLAIVKMEEQHGVRRESVTAVNGGYSPHPSVELWVVPRGAAPPKPKVNKGRVVEFYPAPGEG